MNYLDCKRAFDADDFAALYEAPEGIRFLKIRSFSRREYLDQVRPLLPEAQRDLGTRLLPEAIFASGVTDARIDDLIEGFYRMGRQVRAADEPTLIGELTQVEDFDWGGIYQNNLEKAIVDRYVKRLKTLAEVNAAFTDEITPAVHAWLVASWYNHWTSIIIQDVFFDHPVVIPAVGSVKKVDFFVRNRPYDLKVTYLPEDWVKECRDASGLNSEVSVLRAEARRLGYVIPRDLNGSQLLRYLWRTVDEDPSSDDLIVDSLREYRVRLVADASANPLPLVKWLYENQGQRRFDASHRFFLVLVNTKDFFGSWKLKRQHNHLKSEIGSYLDPPTSGSGFAVDFEWEGNAYSTRADCLVISM